MLGLRTVQGLDPKVFERRFRRRFDCFRPFLEECRTAGYAVEEEGLWHLTPKGFLVSNQIIGGMLDALASEKRRRGGGHRPRRLPGGSGKSREGMSAHLKRSRR